MQNKFAANRRQFVVKYKANKINQIILTGKLQLYSNLMLFLIPFWIESLEISRSSTHRTQCNKNRLYRSNRVLQKPCHSNKNCRTKYRN